MITLKFLATWLKLTGLAALAIALELIIFRGFWWPVVTVGATGLIYLGLTVAMWKEWRAERNGAGTYQYQVIHYTRD